jgi:serine protease Do
MLDEIDQILPKDSTNMQPNFTPRYSYIALVLMPSVVRIVTWSQFIGSFNRTIPTTRLGTGVILDAQGLILTNNHVIEGAQRINVTLNTGANFAADVVGADHSNDLAVIHINAAGLQPARLGNSADLQVGDDIITIDHSLGLKRGPTVSKGVVSALGRSIEADEQTTMSNLIQTDAAINAANSGGPLVNTRAEVIGINTAIIQNSEGIGFSINIDDAKVVVERLIYTKAKVGSTSMLA